MFQNATAIPPHVVILVTGAQTLVVQCKQNFPNLATKSKEDKVLAYPIVEVMHFV